MTIDTEVSRSLATGDGNETVYSTGFRFFANEEVVVTVQVGDDDAVTQVEGVDYTLTGAGASTGTVTFNEEPQDGAVIVIERDVALTQLIVLRRQGTFSEALHEEAFDRAATRDQEIDRRREDLADVVDALTDVTNTELEEQIADLTDVVAALDAVVDALSSTDLVTGSAEDVSVAPDININGTPVLLLAGTFTVPAGGKTVMVSAAGSLYCNSSTTGFSFTIVVNGGAASSGRTIFFNSASFHANWAGSWIVALPAGSVTIELFGVRVSGAGTGVMNADDSVQFTFVG